MTIIWCIVPEVWSMTDRNFCHFGLFFVFYPLNNPKNQNFEKLKKTPGDKYAILLYMLYCYTYMIIYMLYCSWDMAPDRCNYFSFWTILYPFTPLTAQKIKIKKKLKKKKEKNAWRYHHLTQVYQKSWSYVLLFLRYGMWQK